MIATATLCLSRTRVRSGGMAGQDATPQRTAIAYDTLGRVKKITDDETEDAEGVPTGNVTEFLYNAFDERTTVRNKRPSPIGDVDTIFKYDALGRLRIVDAPGVDMGPRLITEFRYDVRGNVTEVIEPGTATSRTTTYKYDPISRLKEVQQPGYVAATSGKNFRTLYAYDARNRLYRLTNGRAERA